MAAKDIVEAFEKEYYPMDFFSNLQCSHPFALGWCAAKADMKKNKSTNIKSIVKEADILRKTHPSKDCRSFAESVYHEISKFTKIV